MIDGRLVGLAARASRAARCNGPRLEPDVDAKASRCACWRARRLTGRPDRPAAAARHDRHRAVGRWLADLRRARDAAARAGSSSAPRRPGSSGRRPRSPWARGRACLTDGARAGWPGTLTAIDPRRGRRLRPGRATVGRAPGRPGRLAGLPDSAPPDPARLSRHRDDRSGHRDRTAFLVGVGTWVGDRFQQVNCCRPTTPRPALRCVGRSDRADAWLVTATDGASTALLVALPDEPSTATRPRRASRPAAVRPADLLPPVDGRPVEDRRDRAARSWRGHDVEAEIPGRYLDSCAAARWS